MHATTTPGAAALAPRVQTLAQPPRYPGALRVTGTLTADAELRPSNTNPPRLLLCLSLQPAHGLPYVAHVDLGTELADHWAAEELLPQMRTGAVASVAAAAMELRADHGHQVLRLLQPHSVLLLQQPIDPTRQD